MEIADALTVHLTGAPESVARMCVEFVGGELVELERVRAALDKWKTVAEERSLALDRADRASRAIRRAVELSASVARSRLGSATRATRRPIAVSSPAAPTDRTTSTALPEEESTPASHELGEEAPVRPTVGSIHAPEAEASRDERELPGEGPPSPKMQTGDGDHPASFERTGVLVVQATAGSAPLTRICVELAGTAIVEAEVLRADLDKWQAVAAERARSLDRVDAALTAVASAVETSAGIAQAAAGLDRLTPRRRDITRSAAVRAPGPGAPAAHSHPPTASDDTATELRTDLRNRARLRAEESRAELAAGKRSKWFNNR